MAGTVVSVDPDGKKITFKGRHRYEHDSAVSTRRWLAEDIKAARR